MAEQPSSGRKQLSRKLTQRDKDRGGLGAKGANEGDRDLSREGDGSLRSDAAKEAKHGSREHARKRSASSESSASSSATTTSTPQAVARGKGAPKASDGTKEAKSDLQLLVKRVAYGEKRALRIFTEDSKELYSVRYDVSSSAYNGRFYILSSADSHLYTIKRTRGTLNPTWQYELQYVGGPKFAKAKRKPGKKVAEMLAETTSFGTVRCDLSSGEDVLDVFDGDKKKLAHSFWSVPIAGGWGDGEVHFPGETLGSVADKVALFVLFLGMCEDGVTGKRTTPASSAKTSKQAPKADAGRFQIRRILSSADMGSAKVSKKASKKDKKVKEKKEKASNRVVKLDLKGSEPEEPLDVPVSARREKEMEEAKAPHEKILEGLGRAPSKKRDNGTANAVQKAGSSVKKSENANDKGKDERGERGKAKVKTDKEKKKDKKRYSSERASEKRSASQSGKRDESISSESGTRSSDVKRSELKTTKPQQGEQSSSSESVGSNANATVTAQGAMEDRQDVISSSESRSESKKESSGESATASNKSAQASMNNANDKSSNTGESETYGSKKDLSRSKSSEPGSSESSDSPRSLRVPNTQSSSSLPRGEREVKDSRFESRKGLSRTLSSNQVIHNLIVRNRVERGESTKHL